MDEIETTTRREEEEDEDEELDEEKIISDKLTQKRWDLLNLLLHYLYYDS